MSHSDQPRPVAFPYVGDTLGGSHISSLILAQNLDRQRYRPLIIIHGEGPLENYIQQRFPELPILRLPLRGYVGKERWHRSIANLLLTLPTLAASIRQQKIEIVHTNDYLMHQTWGVAAKIAGVRHVRHHRAPRFGISVLDRLLATLPDRIVCVSQFAHSGLPDALRPHARIVYNPFVAPSGGLIGGDARLQLLKELQLPEDAFIIGYFGNFEPRKRPDAVAEILGILSGGRRGQFGAVFFGADRHGVREQIVKAANRHGVSDLARFMGHRSPIEPWMAACDAVLLPGVDEPLGRVLIEAMLSGTVVVAANSGGNAEILRDQVTGFLVEPDDLQGFAKAILTLRNSPDLRRNVIEQARKSAADRFSVDTHVQAIVGIYDQVIGKKDDRGSA